MKTNNTESGAGPERIPDEVVDAAMRIVQCWEMDERATREDYQLLVSTNNTTARVITDAVTQLREEVRALPRLKDLLIQAQRHLPDESHRLYDEIEAALNPETKEGAL